MSPNCYRYKEEAVASHAPSRPGVFEFVTFDPSGEGKGLYVGLAAESMAEDLAAHLTGKKQPSVQQLLGLYPNLHFDYVEWSDAKDEEDLKDIAAAFYEEHKPPHNLEPLRPTGRYKKAILKEIEVPTFRAFPGGSP